MEPALVKDRDVERKKQKFQWEIPVLQSVELKKTNGDHI